MRRRPSFILRLPPVLLFAAILVVNGCSKKPAPAPRPGAEGSEDPGSAVAREKELQHVTQKKSELEARVAELEGALRERQSGQDADTARLSAEKRTLEEEIVALGRKELELTGMIADKSKHLERLNALVATADVLRANLIDDISALFEGLVAQFQRVQSGVAQSASTATGARKKALDTLTSSLGLWRGRLKEAGSVLAETPNVAHDALRGVVKEMDAEIARLHSSQEGDDARLGADLAVLSARIEKTRVLAFEKESELARHKREAAALRAEVATLREGNTRLSEKFVALERDLEVQRKENAEAKDARTRLETELRGKETLVTQMRDELAQTREALEKARAGQGGDAARVKELTDKAAALESANAVLKDTVGRIEGEKKALDERIALLNATIARLEGLGGTGGGTGGSTPPGKDFTKIPVKPHAFGSFGEWCENRAALDEVSLPTITAVLAQLGTTDCAKARSYLTHTYNLTLNGMGLVDLRPVSGLWELHTLQLVGNRVSDLAPLQRMSKLKTLFLGDNRIEDLKPLAALSSLRWLVLADNNIESLEGIEALESLEELWLTRNRVKDLSALAKLTNLRRLYLSDNRITDLGPLQGLTQLEILSFSNNPVPSLATVSKLPSLRILAAKKTALAEPEKTCASGRTCLY